MDRIVAIVALLLMLWYGARYVERHRHEFSVVLQCEEYPWREAVSRGMVGSAYGTVESVYGR